MDNSRENRYRLQYIPADQSVLIRILKSSCSWLDDGSPFQFESWMNSAGGWSSVTRLTTKGSPGAQYYNGEVRDLKESGLSGLLCEVDCRAPSGP